MHVLKLMFLMSLTSSGTVLYAQNSICTIIVAPDLKVEFPGKPTCYKVGNIVQYQFSNKEEIFSVTSEQCPLNYYGRSVEDVDKEYFDSLTEKFLRENPTRKLIRERDLRFDGQRMKEIIFTESINGFSATTVIQILVVIGIEQALYKISYSNLNGEETFSQMAVKFFQSLDLYYNFEKGLSPKHPEKRKD